ncbi:hypothetical protein LX36DRAFT_311562 [Colletotrichum falcatum]|nr:hypothetical protein LX36DRAFT_311562 [Colletotrichum falcatum]
MKQTSLVLSPLSVSLSLPLTLPLTLPRFPQPTCRALSHRLCLMGTQSHRTKMPGKRSDAAGRLSRQRCACQTITSTCHHPPLGMRMPWMRFYIPTLPPAARCLSSSMLLIPAPTGLACLFVSHLYPNCHRSTLEVQEQNNPHPSKRLCLLTEISSEPHRAIPTLSEGFDRVGLAHLASPEKIHDYPTDE